MNESLQQAIREAEQRVQERQRKRLAMLDPAAEATFRSRLESELTQDVIDLLHMQVEGRFTERDTNTPEPAARFKIGHDNYLLYWYELGGSSGWELFGSE